jgi:hypothetical protein
LTILAIMVRFTFEDSSIIFWQFFSRALISELRSVSSFCLLSLSSSSVSWICLIWPYRSPYHLVEVVYLLPLVLADLPQSLLQFKQYVFDFFNSRCLLIVNSILGSREAYLQVADSLKQLLYPFVVIISESWTASSSVAVCAHYYLLNQI